MSGIQNWQTLKDLATQLLIKYKSGTLVTQYCFCVSGFLRICVCLCRVWSSQAFPHVVHLDGCVRRLRPSRQWCKVKHVTSSQAKSQMLKSKNVNLHPSVFSSVITFLDQKSYVIFIRIKLVLSSQYSPVQSITAQSSKVHNTPVQLSCSPVHPGTAHHPC